MPRQTAQASYFFFVASAYFARNLVKYRVLLFLPVSNLQAELHKGRLFCNTSKTRRKIGYKLPNKKNRKHFAHVQKNNDSEIGTNETRQACPKTHRTKETAKKAANNHCCSHYMLYSRYTMFEYNKYNNADMTFDALLERAPFELTVSPI